MKILGHQPTVTEVGIFGVMWSEHCAYSSSKIYLRKFPTKGKRVLIPAGKENAGVVDIGHGQAVAFKIESHNHPSAVEPHAGAATGVGGIIRDIFTMGARPLALFDSLRFGTLTPRPVTSPKATSRLNSRELPLRGRVTGRGVNGHARTRFLLDGVVRGIADYGNAVGIPTVGGEIAFDEGYRENPLVNVMCLGIVRRQDIARAKASGAGNPVLYVGSATGRDGLGGASFASREITEGSEADRPAVQIGDPFAEKCLIEATLEALATGVVVGIQDMGAAGLTCSTCETASRGRCGIEIDVAKVPRREEGMTPYDVMLSESQERMLLIVKKGREAKVKAVFAKWGLQAVEIGRVTTDGLMRVKDGEAVAAELPVGALTHEAPVYDRPTRRPRYLATVQRLPLRRIPQPRDYGKALLSLLDSPTVASKAWVFEQYDHMVRTNTLVLPGRSDAAVLRLKGTGSLLAATTDGNGTYCYLDPYAGGQLAVAEAARNLVCTGAEPLAVTDCLNFGNPEDPEVMWQFKECVRGIAEACRVFRTPVTGGNVSFYNESHRSAIDPTPVIGMIGLIETRDQRPETGDPRQKANVSGLMSHVSGLKPVTMGFKDEGDVLILLGETHDELGGSEYLKVLHRRKAGRPPRVNLQRERRLQQLMVEAAGLGLIKSAHDCSEGGLAVALAECCISEEEHLVGATIEFSSSRAIKRMRTDALLFGESSGRIVVTCEPYQQERLELLAARQAIRYTRLGRVGGGRLSLLPWLDLSVDELSAVWRQSLAKRLAAA